MHDGSKEELLAKTQKLIEIAEEMGTPITRELAAFGAQFTTEIGIKELLTLNCHPQRDEMTLDDWIYLWQEWCLARDLEAAANSTSHDCAQAALDRFGIDVDLATHKLSDLAETKLAEDAADIGLFPGDVAQIYEMRAKPRNDARKVILAAVREKTNALHPRHRNWLCGYLRYRHSLTFPDVTVQTDCSSNAWQEKVEEIINTCLALDAPFNFSLLADILKQALWLEEVARR